MIIKFILYVLKNKGYFLVYIIKRVLQLIPILFAITFLSFAMMRLAGSDVVEQKMLNTGQVISETQLDMAREQLGLNSPFLVQYFRWLGNLLHGDMGVSYVSGKDVFETFVSKLPATILLTVTSIALTVIISIPLGVISAVYQNKFIDYVIRFFSFIGNSLPNFFVSLVLMYFLGIKLGWLPIISKDINSTSIIMPTLTLAIAMSSKYLRQVRTTVLDELSKDYIVGAKARGVKFSITLMGSVLRATLVTIITLLALSIGSLLGGTAIVESIFMWDGVGKMAVDAINMRDYPIIQAYVMWMAIIYVLVNLITDLSYRFLDPRIRLGDRES
jgi:peptide/nickel transport system permease protein